MKRCAVLSSLFGVAFLISCGTQRSINLEEVERLTVSTDDQAINFGTDFSLRIDAHFEDGRIKDVTHHPNIAFRSDTIRPVDKDRFRIEVQPTSFHDSLIPIVLEMQAASSILTWKDTVCVNYESPIHICSFAPDGANGLSGIDGGNTLFKRDGMPGKDGGDGDHGNHGGHLTVHCWQENNMTYAHVLHDETGEVWKYKSKNTKRVVIDLSGGNGGDGGNGGQGGRGKPGKKSAEKEPGNGGDGGLGGRGGNGGNEGSALIFIHSNAQALIPGTVFISQPGNAGIGGQGGLPGEAGYHEKGQIPGEHGLSGTRGQHGTNGTKAHAPVISVIPFDYRAFQR